MIHVALICCLWLGLVSSIYGMRCMHEAKLWCGACMRQGSGVVHACGKKVVWCGYDMVMGWLVVFVDGVDFIFFKLLLSGC